MPNIDKVLAELAAKLGISVEQLWPLLVRKTVLDWWTGAATCLLIMAIGLVLLHRSVNSLEKFRARQKDPYADDFLPITKIAIAGSVVFCSTVVFCICFLGRVSVLWYPEAAVIERLLGK